MASGWLDFDAVRRQACFSSILRHYCLRMVGTGEQRFILCPFHKETTPSCSIHLSKGLFHCFGCSAEGTMIDFVARIERMSLRAAALRITKITEGSRGDHRIHPEAGRGPDEQLENDARSDVSVMATLNLEPTHPYLAQRGISAELIELFGLGYCSHGTMRGRVCIPIHDTEGNLVAYAGRWASDAVPRGIPRYLFSRGFRKRQVLFNLQRIIDATTVVLVEGYWSVFRIHQLGIPVVGLMGCSISSEQIALLTKQKARFVTLLLDGDQAGFRSRQRILAALANSFFVRSPVLHNGEKPDMLTPSKLLQLLDTAQDQ
jgi:DNA primase